MSEQKELRYMTAEQLLDGAHASSVAEEVFDELEQGDDQAILDAADIRRQRDWGELAGQVVGAESIPEMH